MVGGHAEFVRGRPLTDSVTLIGTDPPILPHVALVELSVVVGVVGHVNGVVSKQPIGDLTRGPAHCTRTQEPRVITATGRDLSVV